MQGGKYIDAKDKSSFDAFCASVGLNASTAINLFVKAVLRERRIPFEISQSPSPLLRQASHALPSPLERMNGKEQPHELIEALKSLSREDAARIVAEAREQLSNVPEMTLDEINAEIHAARMERKAKQE